jgi:hypothetical protein
VLDPLLKVWLTVREISVEEKGMFTIRHWARAAGRCTAVLCMLLAALVYGEDPAAGDGGEAVRRDLAILREAYPGAFEVVSEPAWGIMFPDGTFVPYDDGKHKDFDTLLDDPDLQDMLSIPYPLGEQDEPPRLDPGRFRPGLFFRALYGNDEAETRSALRAVRWMPSFGGPRVLVSGRFDIDKKLEALAAELEALGPEYRRYLIPPGGTFNYRSIANTGRQSPHSFGIALDIAVAVSNYWEWDGAEPYRNSIPYAIVEIFEKYGFIWGGKWRHFDTMHFEYRPELILKARAALRD